MGDTTFNVLDSAAATVTFRAQAVVGTTLVMMSVPSDPAGTAIIGQKTMASSLSVVFASNQSTMTAFLAGGSAILAGGTALVTLAGGTALLAGGTTSVNLNQVGGSTIVLGVAANVASTIPINVFTTVPSLLTVVSTSGTPSAVAIKASAGTLKNISLYCNNTVSPVFFKVYNLTTGAVNSSIGPKFTVGVPPGAWRDVPLGDGAAFTTAMSYLITGLIATTDTSAVGIDDLHGIVTFI